MPASTRSRMSLAALLLLAAVCPGADADAWRQRGFTVTEKGGVITGLAGPTKGFTADDFRAIAAITTLTSLNLDGGGGALNDDAMRLLGGLADLRELTCNSCDLSDDGFRLVAGFRKLRSLTLFHPSRGRADFTGAGFAPFAELPEFERMTLAGANVGDPALAAIARLPHLRELRLWHNTETADGLRLIAGNATLRKLTVGQRLAGRERKPPSLDDASLAAIAQMPGLEELSLQEARLSGDALLKLKDTPRLKKLTVSQVDTPAADIERVRAALTNVTLDWKPLTDEQAKMLVDKLKL
jgi:hypothetical protein